MFTEACVIVDVNGKPIKWHLPSGRNSVHIPDTQSIWDFIWKNREHVGGTAHTHPGDGMPYPSWEDITTFSATELGLGKRLTWWIASSNSLAEIKWQGPGKYDYAVEDHSVLYTASPRWLLPLRLVSNVHVSTPMEGDLKWKQG